jgi:outer membrane receptor protein involved in Fe transport
MRKGGKNLRHSLMLSALMLAPGLDDAFAQDTALPGGSASTQAGGVISYPSSFFAEFRPSNALDMIERIPGFSFEEGDSDIRGFAGSGGNVLIDGAAPSTKSIRLPDLLRRISPASVLRIELIRGGAPGIDMQGRSVVANVVRTDETAVTGSVRPEIVFFGGAIGRSLRADLTRRSNTMTVSGNLEISNEKNSASVSDIIRLNNSGLVRDRGPQSANHWERTYAAAATLESTYGNNGTIIANLGMDLGKENKRDTTVRSTPAGVTTTDLSSEISKDDEYEISLDYEREFGAVTLHTLALKNFTYQKETSISGEGASLSTSNSKTNSGEGIVRATLAGDYSDWLSLEGGAEGAINNRYDSQTRTVGGVNFVVPNSNVRVEEKRAEIFTTANASLWPGLRSEWGVRYEASAIRQSGDTNKESFFSFVKPRAIFTYDLTDVTQLRARVERTVGQLDFSSFAASVDFVNGTVTAGNANLEPERAWEYELTWDQRFWDKGAFTLSYLHAEVEAINDRIVVVTPTGTFDAPGNIGRGTRDVVEINLALPLDRLGLAGGTLKPHLTWRDSKVTDAVTGRTRRSTGETLLDIGFAYIQDIEPLNSTLTIEGSYGTGRWSYRLRELTYEASGFALEITWDWKIAPDLTLQISADDVVPHERFRDRTFFTGTRLGPISAFETNATPFEPEISVALRKSF